ncbi:hypothetical protein K8R78_02055 [bacterium]|nr:hypothetical protein [bacterium]
MKKKLLMITLLVAVFVFLAGCAPTGSGNSGEDVVGSLEWARKIAEEVRDAELPDAYYCTINGVTVDDSCKIEQTGHWRFSFYNADDGIWISVTYDGETTTTFIDGYGSHELAKYSNSNASGWISAADEAVDADSLNFDHRSIEVMHCTDYDGVDTIVDVMYFSDSEGITAIAVIDAATGEVLEVYP